MLRPAPLSHRPSSHPLPLTFSLCSLTHPLFSYPPKDLTTAFIPDEYPDGYSGHVLTAAEHADLLACTASLQYVYERRWEGLRTPDPKSVVSGVDSGHRIERSLRVRLNASDSGAGDGLALGAAGESESEVTVSLTAPFIGVAGALLPSGVVLDVTGSGRADGESWQRSLKLLSTGLGPDGLMEARFLMDANAERPMAVQVIERKATGWSVSAFGTTYEVLARTGAVADLSQHMKPPPKSALDGALLSPMPGTLLSVSVEVWAVRGSDASVLSTQLSLYAEPSTHLADDATCPCCPRWATASLRARSSASSRR